ncbi:MAG: hypothetical protein M0Z30_07305 [Actinomycetota bacterium]|nr:hypothetical protein [Actinomycetota bacterium]
MTRRADVVQAVGMEAERIARDQHESVGRKVRFQPQGGGGDHVEERNVGTGERHRLRVAAVDQGQGAVLAQLAEHGGDEVLLAEEPGQALLHPLGHLGQGGEPAGRLPERPHHRGPESDGLHPVAPGVADHPPGPGTVGHRLVEVAADPRLLGRRHVPPRQGGRPHPAGQGAQQRGLCGIGDGPQPDRPGLEGEAVTGGHDPDDGGDAHHRHLDHRSLETTVIGGGSDGGGEGAEADQTDHGRPGQGGGGHRSHDECRREIAVAAVAQVDHHQEDQYQ